MHWQSIVYDVRDVLTIRELFEGTAETHAERTAFLFHEGEGVREVTYAEALENVQAFATYLHSLGLGGKKIGVIGKNGYAWALSYLAVACGVGVIVPIDRELKADELAYVAADAELGAILYRADAADRVEALDGVRKLPLAELDSYLEAGRALLAAGDTSYADHSINPRALGILLYTSGTTGLAKGVMLSQYNICSNIVRVLRRLKFDETDRVLSVLPLHHTYEANAGFLAPLYIGASIAYNDSLHRLQSDFKLFQPTVFVAVPLVLEKLRSLILKKYAQLRGGNAILALQRRASDITGRADGAVSRKIFGTVNQTLGGKLSLILCGAALLPPDVFTDLERFGFRVCIGYGLTETAPVCLMHNDFYRAPGDIGYPLSGTQVMLADPDENGIGELAVKGPQVMLGYYKNPEETSRVLKDGWFYTGDLAERLPNGAYRITGRKKSMIVTQNGKKIFPEELEFYLAKSELIAECLVYGEDGDRDVIVTAAIYPDHEVLDARLAQRGITPESEEYTDAVRTAITEEVKRVNEKLPSFRRIAKIIVRKNEFEKTSSRKIRRAAEGNRGE